MTELISDLFINCLILIASVTIGNLAIRDRFLNKSVKNSFILGGLASILGILLMLYSVHVSLNVIIDFRYIPIILMGVFFTFTATLTAAFIIGVFRVAFYGINEASIIAVIIILLFAFLCAAFGRTKNSLKIKWGFSAIVATVLSSIGIYLALPATIPIQNVLTVYIIGMTVASISIYILITYTMRLNSAYIQLKDRAEKDFLTGLKNVRHFDEAINKYKKESSGRESLSLLFIDIDYFKKVNDKFGHLSGDTVLRDIGKILIENSRENDIATRIGGEEFTLLLTNCSLEQAKQVAERIRFSIERHDFISDLNKVIKITVSVGVSSFPDTTPDIDKLVEQADIALYNAKRSGRNRISVASFNE